MVCYLLQIKDRHNGNILVDREGHVIHIDFGFMLSNSPGSLGFEMAPFKLTQEYIDLLGGFESEHFAEFKTTFKRLFIVARKHAERIIMLVELMQTNSTLPCFMSGEATSRNLRERFQLSLTQTQVDEFLEKLVVSAAMSTFTRLYECVRSIPHMAEVLTLYSQLVPVPVKRHSVALVCRSITEKCTVRRSRPHNPHGKIPSLSLSACRTGNELLAS